MAFTPPTQPARPEPIPPFLWALLGGDTSLGEQAMSLGQPLGFGTITSRALPGVGRVIVSTGDDLLPQLYGLVGRAPHLARESADWIRAAAEIAKGRGGLGALVETGSQNWPALGRWLADEGLTGPVNLPSGATVGGFTDTVTKTAVVNPLLGEPGENALHEALHLVDVAAERAGGDTSIPRRVLNNQYQDWAAGHGAQFLPTLAQGEREIVPALQARRYLGLPYQAPGLIPGQVDNLLDQAAQFWFADRRRGLALLDVLNGFSRNPAKDLANKQAAAAFRAARARRGYPPTW